MRKIICLIFLFGLSCSTLPAKRNSNQKFEPATRLNQIAETYVKLALNLGEHNSDYVLSYYGPKEWRDDAKLNKKTLPKISEEARALENEIASLEEHFQKNTPEHFRYLLLGKLIRSLGALTKLFNGQKMGFDEQTREIYDVVTPEFSDQFFQDILNQLSQELPGQGSLEKRAIAFESKYRIRGEIVGLIQQKAIEYCRNKTREYLKLPANETFTLLTVRDKKWSAFNNSQGNAKATIQINLDWPITPEMILDFAAHEGYPGHHVMKSLIEERLMKGNGWVEHSIMPLFSPLSFTSEGTGKYATRLAFSEIEEKKFLSEVVFPLAGFNPLEVDDYMKTYRLFNKLQYTGLEATRRYVNKVFNRNQTVEWLMKYRLRSRERAERSFGMIEKYESYLVNVTYAGKFVADFIDSRMKTNTSNESRWKLFEELILNPRPASAY